MLANCSKRAKLDGIIPNFFIVRDFFGSTESNSVYIKKIVLIIIFFRKTFLALTLEEKH